MALSRSATSY